jgi:hypothetical protein
MLAPLAADTGVKHVRTARPEIMAVQAPHCPNPHPNLGPLKPSSRNA